VIAEGLETHEQVDFLIQKNCDEIRGYFFSRRLPALEIEQFFNK
jgi:EAL domain-containing protein (putative c-di-GMP-specific phosphodiesterase class I)